MTTTTTDSDPDGLPSLPAAVEDRLYEILLDHPLELRGPELDALLVHHPECRDAILRRAAAMTAGNAILDRARHPLTSAADPALAEPPLPQRIGDYEITGLLGEGGFGTVYRAQQHQPVERTVALKVLHPRRLDERSRWRFLAERQTLARMQHPNIAQMFDAGSTTDGLHYFAMELVDGQPLTRWCDDRRLSLDDRLELFAQVCSAVEHAHQRGVVHRDLKPSNVLVQADDGRGVPKVIDFGIAKVLETEDGSTLATRDGALIGTPGYMSPEQAASQPVDTRTDVYALGVLLYELLTSDLPFRRSRLLGNVAEVARIVREEDPRRLSTAARQADTGLDEIAVARNSSAGRLLRDLQGDLEWIVRRALAKQPDQRYASVSEFLADIDRFRRLEPVSARVCLCLSVVGHSKQGTRSPCRPCP
ncbi:MAG: serine/threonine protein kinase, partial [bacterium]|nr:serine/threonine protein kinase [bacterium]